MGKKTVHVSDFTGDVIPAGTDVVRIVVLEHPDLVAGPVRLDALPAEVESVDDASLDVAVVEIHDGAEGEEPRRVVLTAGEFDALATDVPMAQLLRTAERVRPAKTPRKGAERVDYSTLEHAGKPHRGRVTEDEALLVRTHLDEINKRLADEGLRQIDAADPDHAGRYGFSTADVASPQQGESETAAG